MPLLSLILSLELITLLQIIIYPLLSLLRSKIREMINSLIRDLIREEKEKAPRIIVATEKAMINPIVYIIQNQSEKVL